MDEHAKNQLQHVYALFRAGQRAAAFELLEPILKSQPDNEVAWWLAAQIVANPRDVQYALRQVLRIRPDHADAQARLAELTAAPPSPPVRVSAPSTSQQAAPRQPTKNSFSPLWVVGLLVALGLSLAVVWVLYQRLSNEESQQPTIAAQSTSPGFSQPTQSQAAVAAAPTTAPRQGPTLPPTWTPAPTVPTPTRAPFSPIPSRTRASFPSLTPPFTVDAASYGDMYWEGDGSGITMEFYFEDGRYLRFYEFPVTVYYDPGDVTEGANVWAYAFENALRELNQVVQIEATDDRENANIIISVVPPEQLATACVIREVGVLAGCASMGRIGGATKPFVRGLAFVATDSHNPVGVVLHELLHALGVVVHSPDPDDIMYFEETQIKKLSARDLNTLRRLYDSPSYGD